MWPDDSAPPPLGWGQQTKHSHLSSLLISVSSKQFLRRASLVWILLRADMTVTIFLLGLLILYFSLWRDFTLTHKLKIMFLYWTVRKDVR